MDSGRSAALTFLFYCFSLVAAAMPAAELVKWQHELELEIQVREEIERQYMQVYRDGIYVWRKIPGRSRI